MLQVCPLLEPVSRPLRRSLGNYGDQEQWDNFLFIVCLGSWSFLLIGKKACSSHILHLADLFIPTPAQLLHETFSHAAITAQKFFLHTIPSLSVSRYLFYAAELNCQKYSFGQIAVPES